MKKYVIKVFLALPVICLLSSFSSGHDGGDIIQVPQMKQEPSHASHLTDDGYFDGLLYYKITSNTTNEVAVVKAESSAINVTIPNQVIIDGKTYTCTRINDNAFKELKRLTSVTIPNSVTYIGERAFSGCRGLTSVAIPNSVTSIRWGAFEGCSSLTSVHITDLNAWCKIEFLNYASNPLFKAAHLYLNGKEIKNLVIPNSVTSIGNYAFYGCSELISVTIPNGVISIGSGAFDNCSSLTSVTIPNSVTSIGGSAFYGCSSLTSISIPNRVISIGDYTFYGCSGLTSVTIPNGVTFIGESAFQSCSSLSSITIPDGVTSIGSAAFYKCSSLTSVTIPNSVTSISGSAFEQCSSLTSLTIPNGVTSIGNGAFSGCIGLTSITIPNSVIFIGSWTFHGCSGLTSITIPNSVTDIGYGAFWDCKNLLEVVSLIEDPFGTDGFDNNICKNSTLYVPIGTKKEYKAAGGWEDFVHIIENISQGKVSEGVTYIYDKRTHTLTISGQGPMEIGDFDAGEFAPWLAYKNDIQHVIIESGVTSIGSDAFHWCSSLTSVTIPNSVTSIGCCAFEGCSALTSVTIPKSVTSIENGVFWGCSGLTSITIHRSVTSIGETSFSGCYGLNSILVENGNQKYDSRNNCNAIIETSSNSLIVGCKNTIIPNSVISIGEDAFSGCSGLTSIIIPNSVTSIGGGAFSGCSGLTSIIIPNSVTSIGSGAFQNCSSLTSINIPSSVTSIGGGAFSGTKWYDNQPNGIVYAGRFAYNYKGDMPANSQIIIEEGTIGIVNLAFYNCSNMTSITIPSSVTTIGGAAFCGCSALTSITIPSSVTSIGNSTFSNCSSLISITIPESVTSIGNNAFYNCSSLTDYFIWVENVPSTNGYSFSSAGIEKATLHVPAASVDLYRQTDPWSGFGRIVPLTDEDPKPTSMKGIIRSDNLKGDYYDLSGRKVNNPKKGIYIKNGKKVVLK